MANGPLAAALTDQLPDIGDGLAGAFATLHRAPEPSSCEDLAIRLQGAARHVMRLRETLMSEATTPRQDG